MNLTTKSSVYLLKLGVLLIILLSSSTAGSSLQNQACCHSLARSVNVMTCMEWEFLQKQVCCRSPTLNVNIVGIIEYLAQPTYN
jgi:hypothetical protein